MVLTINWAFLGVVVGILLVIVNFIDSVLHMWERRRLILKTSRFVLKVAKWGSIKLTGLGLTFFGSTLLLSTMLAGGVFAVVGANMLNQPAQLVGLSIGGLIAFSISAFGGLLMLGTGLWMTAPKHRVGRFGKSLVVNRLFRRGRQKDGNDVPDMPAMGLILKLPIRL